MSLSEEQRRRAEESRAKALALRASRLQSPATHARLLSPTSSAYYVSHPPGHAQSTCSSSPSVSVREGSRSLVVGRPSVPQQQLGAGSDAPDAKRFKSAVGSSDGGANYGPVSHKVGGATVANARPVSQKVGGVLCTAGVGTSPGQTTANVGSLKSDVGGRAIGRSAVGGGGVQGVSERVVVRLVLVSGERFVAEARWCAPLVELFKAVETRQYGQTPPHSSDPYRAMPPSHVNVVVLV